MRKRYSLTLFLTAFALLGMLRPISAIAQEKTSNTPTASQITQVNRLNPTSVELIYSDGNRATVDFYGDNIFRFFRDDNGGIVRNPVATPPAEILVKQPREALTGMEVEDKDGNIYIETPVIRVQWDKSSGLMTVTDLRNGNEVLQQTAPITFNKKGSNISFAEQDDEYFYGGGVQNGRFSHKGNIIAIENQNSWTDGGVASPNPFYWSTNGYGIMFHTFAPGKYDFGATEPGIVNLHHGSEYMDMFVMVDQEPVGLLNDFYQLTGNPVLLPKFAFYEGHLNAYNRDYWAEDTTGKGILFEDGKRYKESQRDNGGVKESLNGEKDNYQFSARAVVDRYASHDMPLGWILPNDGYGAGYGQTETLDGNIENLKEFGDYARSKGVEIGLWTQSDLHPKEGVSALLQRDIVKEVRDAGVRALKTDVAWVGWGYSFGLNGVADVGEIMPYYGNDARPFIISLDGWAGTQRYAAIWSGDQTGGEWEYIRFHIPTYIGSGLSGNPNISSDMDGIFGGKNPIINTRDFQWKTFTPMQLNMDGWGYNEKYPHALGEPATSINRNYLKLKSELLPYSYTWSATAIDGEPLIRPMFMEEENPYTLGAATRYQFMYGPSFLVAPIYQATAPDSLGNDIRNGIYLPNGTWYDYFSGDKYDGGVIINSFDAPLWKLPVFVKGGAIIPMANPSNNPSQIDKALRIYEFYPEGFSETVEYDDDGTTQSYMQPGNNTLTRISSNVMPNGKLVIKIAPTEGSYKGFVPEKTTELLVNATQAPKSVTAAVGNKKVKLLKASSLQEFENSTDVYFYNPEPELNRFSTPGSKAAEVSIAKNPQIMVKIAKVDTKTTPIEVTIENFANNPVNKHLSKTGKLNAPNITIPTDSVSAYSFTPTWEPVTNADFYEIEFDDMLYTLIKDNEFLIADLNPETDYTLKARAVNADGASDWTEISTRTLDNPYEWAIRNIRGEASCKTQPGFEVFRLFDFAESGDMWHSLYRANALPFDLTIDLRTINTLDKFRYLPRTDGGNGTFLKGSVAVSLDKEHWTPVDTFEWKRNGEPKEFVFVEHPTARYIKISVTEGVNNYGAGRELYVFKVPGTESYLPGDINSDGRIDNADLTSYSNYTGLRKGDSDFEGYISTGDINNNGLIDSYDISVVATQLGDDLEIDEYAQPLSGSISFDIPQSPIGAGEELTIIATGDSLASVNALSFAIPFDANTWEFVGVEPIGLKEMENLTIERMHTNGDVAVYPTFVNIGEKPAVEGNDELLKITFRAKKRGAFTSRPIDGMLVDKRLNTIKF